jgi:HEAT repeat protein
MRVHAEPATPNEADVPAALIESIASIFAGFIQALRSLQLYGPTSPACTRALDSVRTAFEHVWERVPEIEVHLTASTILFRGQPVYENTNHNDSLAFLMFRDGIRLLVFRSGFEQEEMLAFLRTLHRARYQPTESEDLVTLLWDDDFVHFLHGYIDAEAAADDEMPTPERVAAAASASRNLALQIHDSSARAVADNYSPSGDASTADPPLLPGSERGLKPASMHLEPETFVYLQHELQEEVGRDLRRDVLSALLDSLEDSEPRAQSEILEILGGFLPRLLKERRIVLATDVLRELRAIGDEKALDDLRRRQLGAIFSELATSEAVEDLIAALESGDLQAETGSVEMLATHFGPALLPRLLRAREKSGGKELRTALEAACEELVRRYPEALNPQLRSRDALVLRTALHIQRNLGRVDLLPETIHNLEHADARVRLAAVDVLVALGGKASLTQLLPRLSDDVRAVRVAALWGLATWRYEPALEVLAAAIDSKSFRTVEAEERTAMLDAYAQIGGARAVERLGGLLTGRVLLKPREPSEIRAGAARALGLTGLPEARALLERCRKDGDAEVQRAVQRALRRTVVTT